MAAVAAAAPALVVASEIEPSSSNLANPKKSPLPPKDRDLLSSLLLVEGEGEGEEEAADADATYNTSGVDDDFMAMYAPDFPLLLGGSGGAEDMGFPSTVFALHDENETSLMMKKAAADVDDGRSRRRKKRPRVSFTSDEVGAMTSSTAAAAVDGVDAADDDGVTGFAEIVCSSDDAAAAAAAAAAVVEKQRRERHEELRARNREHARCTRQRRKDYIARLKKTITSMTMEQEAAEAVDDDDDRECLVKERVRRFFECRSRAVKDRTRWEAVLDESFEFCLPVAPHMPYPKNAEVDGHTVRMSGIDNCLADAISFNDMISRVSRNGQPVCTEYTIDVDDILIVKDTVMCQWKLSTLDAMKAGARNECHADGMMRGKLSPSDRLLSASLTFDVMSFSRQLDSAKGEHGNFAWSQPLRKQVLPVFGANGAVALRTALPAPPTLRPPGLVMPPAPPAACPVGMRVAMPFMAMVPVGAAGPAVVPMLPGGMFGGMPMLPTMLPRQMLGLVPQLPLQKK